MFHSLLLRRSVLNTDQIMHKALLLVEGKFQGKQLILSPPLWNCTFLRTGKKDNEQLSLFLHSVEKAVTGD